MNGGLFAAFALVAVGACSRSSRIEDRLIGTWEMPASIIVYDRAIPDADFPIISKEVVQITFTADHKEIWRDSNGQVANVARWHIERDDLVFTLETESEAGPPGTTKREKIKTVTSDELVFTDGTSEGRWKRVR